MGKIVNLTVKWGTSRGRDTYGYTTCSLWERYKKKASCNGGGYDMQGTVIAKWIQNEFQNRLLKIAKKGYSIYDVVPNGKTYETDTGRVKKGKPVTETRKSYDYNPVKSGDRDGLYGMTVYRHKESGTTEVSLDGACGLSSILEIAKEIGLAFRRVYDNSNLDVWTVEVDEDWDAQ